MPNSNITVTRTCHCDHTEIFTYRDWQKHGFQVQRGERGVHTTEYRVSSRGREYDAKVVTFCLCQVGVLSPGTNPQLPKGDFNGK